MKSSIAASWSNKLTGLSLLAITLAVCGPSFADVVTLENKPFNCAEADIECAKQLPLFQKLHWEKHIEEARLAIEQARLATVVEKRKVAAELATAEASLLTAATSRRDAERMKAQEKLEHRARNLPGIRFSEATLKSSDQESVSCNALPYVRWSCAIRADCDSNVGKCPSKRECVFPLKNQDICYLPPNSKEPFELTITYSCDGVVQPLETLSVRSSTARFVCDLR